MQTNIIYNEDCLDTMRAMADNSVDLILTDPPYGIGESSKKQLSRVPIDNEGRWKNRVAKDYGEFNWDIAISEKYVKEMLRVSKNQIIWGGNHYAHQLPASPGWLVWDKENGKSHFSDCELAWTSFSKGVRMFKWLWAGFRKKHPEERYHPTQKPLELMKWCLEGVTKRPAIVYDPFAGSGTTLLACQEVGVDYIGSEISKEYCGIAEQRLLKELKPKKGDS